VIKKKIFVICPVRNADKATNEKILRYIERLEKQGHTVHWPPRDTDQSDPVGNKICLTNMTEIFKADEIHIWYDPASTGSHFDLGGVFMLVEVLGYEKRVILINDKEAKQVPGKSFTNVIRYMNKSPAMKKRGGK